MIDLVAAIIGRVVGEIALQAGGELIVRGILWAFHATARVALPIGTFGYVQAEPIEQPGSPKLFRIYCRDRTVIVGVGHAVLLGMIFWIAVGYIVLTFK